MLDRGYWPETGFTPPDDEALRDDVEWALALGFNGVLKHQQVAAPRYLYWADRLGLLVCAGFPNAERLTARGIERFTREWLRGIERDASHPCIAAWVPFGQSVAEGVSPGPMPRDYATAIYHLTKTVDPKRLVVGDGAIPDAADVTVVRADNEQIEQTAAELRLGEHDEAVVLSRLLRDNRSSPGRPVVLGGLGGIRVAPSAIVPETDRAEDGQRATEERFLGRYAALWEAVRSLPALAGCCYTQLTDTPGQATGLLDAARRPKVPFEALAQATMGTPTPRALEMMKRWALGRAGEAPNWANEDDELDWVP